MNELKKQINELLKKTLNKENNQVADTIKYTESMKVEEEVYQKYKPPSPNGEPWVYERRKLGGGLADPENMYHEAQEVDGKIKMKILNLTPPNEDHNQNNLKDGEVAQLVEGGHGAHGLKYSYSDGINAEQYIKPRPFQKATKEELERNKGHVQALENELRAQGLNITKKK